MSSDYENFRTVLTMNLCSVLPAEYLNDVLQMVDVTLNDFEISKKSMEIIKADGLPEVVKIFIASKAISNLSHATLRQYNYKLTNFFNTIRKSYVDIQTNDIRLYLYNYKSEHNASDRYIESIRITLNGFFQWLVSNEYLQKNPCAKIEPIKYQAKKREPLSSYELEYLRRNAEDVREKALIDFFFSTGCRVSECADIRLSDINWNERSVLIRHGKGNKERTVYFNAESEVTLREYLSTRNDQTDSLFVSERNPHHALKSHALEDIIKKASRRTGISVYPHKLRHNFATSAIKSGMPLPKLQVLMGHSKADTTMIYTKIDQTDLKIEHERVYD